MTIRFAYQMAPLALAIPLYACALCALPPEAAAADAPFDQENAADAKALKVAELKLAALAKEAKAAEAAEAAEKAGAQGPQRKGIEQKPAVKKQPVNYRKKKLAKRARVVQAKGETAAKVPKVLNRRLTEAEVQGILATTRDFSGTDLSGLSLVGMDLSGVKLNRANLHLANLERADLAESDLELADLSGANLRGASLNQARLRGTRLEGAKMDGTMWIDKTVCKKGSLGNCVE